MPTYRAADLARLPNVISLLRIPLAALAIRLAAVVKVPVEVILTGKMAVQPPVIGVAA